MSLGSPAHALNMQTNINQNRYFFATAEAGEQELFLSTLSGGGPQGNISSLAVGITGPSGNAVTVSEAPTFIASEFIEADQGMATGVGGYWTVSSISTNITGLSFSADRSAGSGTACIESYSGNGSLRGFEFLTRGVDAALVSSGTLMDGYISSIGRPGATAVLGGTGTLVTPSHTSGVYNAYTSPPTGSGQGIFAINDLSGANGVTPQARWAIGTTNTPTGSNVGCDYALFAYGDAGNFLNSPYQIRRADGAMAITNLSSINGEPFDLSGVIPWEVYTVTNTATQAVALTAGVPQTVLTFSNIPAPAQGVNNGGLSLSVPIAVSCGSLTGNAIVSLAALYGGSISGGTGVYNTLVLNPTLSNNTLTLSGVAIHNGTSNLLQITAVTDTTATFNFTQGSSAFHKFWFQPVF